MIDVLEYCDNIILRFRNSAQVRLRTDEGIDVGYVLGKSARIQKQIIPLSFQRRLKWAQAQAFLWDPKEMGGFFLVKKALR